MSVNSYDTYEWKVIPDNFSVAGVLKKPGSVHVATLIGRQWGASMLCEAYRIPRTAASGICGRGSDRQRMAASRLRMSVWIKFGLIHMRRGSLTLPGPTCSLDEGAVLPAAPLVDRLHPVVEFVNVGLQLRGFRNGGGYRWRLIVAA